jgi:hypothetical protein
MRAWAKEVGKGTANLSNRANLISELGKQEFQEDLEWIVSSFPAFLITIFPIRGIRWIRGAYD